MLSSIHSYLAVVVQRQMYELQTDVTSAFSLCALEENVYMEFPHGMKHQPGEDKVLKQGSYNWRVLVDRFMKDQGFQCDGTDPCWFWKYVDGKHLLQVLCWTDDFRAAGDRVIDVENFTTAMKASFPCRDVPTTKFIGMQIRHDRQAGIMGINMEEKIDLLLEATGLTDCKSVSTPAIPNSKLTRLKEGEESDGEMSALWIARAARSDALYAVNQLTPHLTKPGPQHNIALKHLLRYFKGTKSMELRFHRDPSRGQLFNLTTYSDSDFAGEPQENEFPMRSLSGTCIMLEGVGAIVTSSTLQSTISRNTQESEYRALGKAAELTLGPRHQFEAMHLLAEGPSLMHVDNQAAIQLTKNVLCQAKTRHIKLDHHFIREVQANGHISVIYCPTKENVADIFTKALPKPQFEYLRAKLMGHES